MATKNPLIGKGNSEFGWLFDHMPNGEDDIAELLRQKFGTFGMYDDDWAREDANQAVDWQKILNERAYNENMRDEERAYNNPTALLGRLMSTGMSRQAALQLLAQMNGGGGSPIQSPASPLSGDSASPSEKRREQARTAVQAFMSLMSFGVSASAAAATNSLQSAQAIAQKQANDAQVASAEFNGIVYDAEKAGIIDPKSMDFDSCVAALNKVSSAENEGIYNFMNGGKMRSLMSTPGAYSIASQNYNTRFGNQNALTSVRQQNAVAAAQEMSVESLISSIDKNNAEVQKIFSEINSIDVHTELDQLIAPLERQNIVANTQLAQAERSVAIESADLISEQARGAHEQANIIAISARRMQLTADTYDDIASYDAHRTLQLAIAQNDPKVLQNAISEIVNNQTYMSQIAYFNAVSARDLTSLKESNPEMWNNIVRWHALYNDADLGTLFANYFNNSTTTHTAFKHSYESYREDYINFMGTFGYDYKDGKFVKH